MQITFPVDFPFTMPDDRQFTRLFLLVSKHYPYVVPATFPTTIDRDRAFKSFAYAFMRLSSLRRTPTLGPKNRVDRWAAECEGFYREKGESRDIHPSLLLGAAIAAADIPFSVDQTRFPHDTFIGVGYAGAPAVPAWKGLLDGSRRLLAPSVVETMPRAPSRPLNIAIEGGKAFPW